MLEGHLLNERYKIKATIGGGGMANVYLAWDTFLNRDVAIKVLRLEYANDEEFIARFDREAQSATSLSHPNIVNIFDVGEEAHILYMVMEYVDGLTLKEYVHRYGAIEAEEAVNIMKQVTSAITHAHAFGLVHRDIKPQNILMDSYGNVKVTDFGIAIALSATSLTQTNSILGSVHYLSPEQARGGTATKKSDIYSLGIVLFELLTGKLPFSGQSPIAIALQHLQSETPSVKRSNPSVPQSLENIVLKATAKNPFNRYETVYEMEEALERALEVENLNEPKYMPPIEVGQETRVIPIITDGYLDEDLNGDTIILNTNLDAAKALEDQRDREKLKEIDQEVKVSKKGKKRAVLFSIIFTLIILSIAALFIVPNMMKPKDVSVPDVIDKKYTEAEKELQLLNFNTEIAYTYSEDIDVDHVIKTDPKYGKTAKEQSTITMYVSQGKEKKPMEDYVGESYDQVKAALIEAGYSDVHAYEKFSDRPIGEIIAQVQPLSETMIIPSETRVIFEISNGPEQISLSNLLGMTESDAEEYLREHQFVINRVEAYSDHIPKGLVIKQSPVSGTKLGPNASVDVIISKGPPDKKPIPYSARIVIPYDVTGIDELDDADELREEQHIKIYIGDMNHDIATVYHEENIFADKEITIPFTIEPKGNAKYRIFRDEKLIMDETILYEEGE